MPPDNSEIENRKAPNLSKETLRVLDSRPEVALKLIAQVPEITKLAQGALDDAAKAYDAALTSNAGSQEMVHQIHLELLRIFEAELLRKDLTPEERTRVLDEIRDVNSNALLKDTENKRFISAQFDKKLAAGAKLAAVIVIAFAAGRSGVKPTLVASRLFGS